MTSQSAQTIHPMFKTVYREFPIYVGGRHMEAFLAQEGPIPKSLETVREKGYEPLFMNQLADARINAPSDYPLWKDPSRVSTEFDSVSSRMIGRTSKGSEVAVYAHIPTYVSDSEILRQTMVAAKLAESGQLDLRLIHNKKSMYFVDVPQSEFDRVVDLDEMKDDKGNRLVWVIDHASLVHPRELYANSIEGEIPVEIAMGHAQTVPFLGGEKRATDYLKKHQEIIGSMILDTIGFDLNVTNQPTGTLLGLGWYGGGWGDEEIYHGMQTGFRLDQMGYFIGVREETQDPEHDLTKPLRETDPELMAEALAELGTLKKTVRPELMQSLERLVQTVRTSDD